MLVSELEVAVCVKRRNPNKKFAQYTILLDEGGRVKLGWIINSVMPRLVFLNISVVLNYKYHKLTMSGNRTGQRESKQNN